jgi:hypothetical protein
MHPEWQACSRWQPMYSMMVAKAAGWCWGTSLQRAVQLFAMPSQPASKLGELIHAAIHSTFQRHVAAFLLTHRCSCSGHVWYRLPAGLAAGSCSVSGRVFFWVASMRIAQPAAGPAGGLCCESVAACLLAAALIHDPSLSECALAACTPAQLYAACLCLRRQAAAHVAATWSSAQPQHDELKDAEQQRACWTLSRNVRGMHVCLHDACM